MNINNLINSTSDRPALLPDPPLTLPLDLFDPSTDSTLQSRVLPISSSHTNNTLPHLPSDPSAISTVPRSNTILAAMIATMASTATTDRLISTIPLNRITSISSHPNTDFTQLPLPPSSRKRAEPETESLDKPRSKKKTATLTQHPLCIQEAFKLSGMNESELSSYFTQKKGMRLIAIKKSLPPKIYLIRDESNKTLITVKLHQLTEIESYEAAFKKIAREIAGYILLKNHHFPIISYLNLNCFISIDSTDKIISLVGMRHFMQNTEVYSTYLNALENYLKDHFTDGYYLVSGEEIINSYKIPDSDEEILEQMKTPNSSLSQLKAMFSKAFEMKIDLDLKEGKIGRGKEGTLLFTGLYSMDEDFQPNDPLQQLLNRRFKKANPFEARIRELIDSFTQNINILRVEASTLFKLQKFLDPRQNISIC